MILSIKNVGRLYDKTQIKLDGITVLAGENGTGKSTVGKSLFCVFDSFYDIDEQIKRQRVASVTGVLRREAVSVNIRENPQLIRQLAEKIVDGYHPEDERSFVLDIIKRLYNKNENSENVEETTDKIITVLSVSDNVIEENLFMRRLSSEFGENIGNVNYPADASCIEVEIQGRHINCEIHNSKVKVDKNINLLKDIVYVGDTSVIDFLSNSTMGILMGNDYSHISNLIRKVSGKKESSTVIDDYIMDEKLADIIHTMDIAGIGDVRWKAETGWMYKAQRLKEDISLKNISSGVKGLVILRQLIKNGYFEEKGVIILDEPEIHLHPIWQEVYAQIIIRLQKELNLTVLISTHSMDFLSFIEYHSRKIGVSEKCNYYLIRENEDGVTSTIEDKTDSIDEIYAGMSGPFLRISEKLDVLKES